MEWWLELAGGPLFALAFLVMLLGLARLAVTQIHDLVLRKGRRLRMLPWRRMAIDSLSWLVPIRHLVQGTILVSAASFLFHVGAILVPLFLVDHVVLWERFLGVDLPAMEHGLADGLTLLTLGCIAVLLVYRAVVRRARELSRPSDYVILVLIMMPFLSGVPGIPSRS